MATAELFVPPTNPSFVWNVTDKFSTNEFESNIGHRTSRARRDRKLRIWQLQWLNAPQGDLDYLRAFFEFHLGGALAFCWELPDASLFTPGPAFSAMTAVQGPNTGSLADGTYDLQYTFGNGTLAAETLASPVQQVVVAAGGGSGSIDVTMPPRLPADADRFGFYVELNPTAPVREREVTVPGSTFALNALAGSQALPTVNQMQATPLVNLTDEPVYDRVSASIWVVTVLFRELLA